MELLSTQTIFAASALANLNKVLGEGKGSNADEYKALKTTHSSPELWWNSLDELGKGDVGAFAVHMMFMTANCRWGMAAYNRLPKSQTKRINQIFKVKDQKWQAFNISNMLIK